MPRTSHSSKDGLIASSQKPRNPEATEAKTAKSHRAQQEEDKAWTQSPATEFRGAAKRRTRPGHRAQPQSSGEEEETSPPTEFRGAASACGQLFFSKIERTPTVNCLGKKKKKKESKKRKLVNGVIVSSDGSDSISDKSSESLKTALEDEFEAPLRKRSKANPGSVLRILVQRAQEALNQGALVEAGPGATS